MIKKSETKTGRRPSSPQEDELVRLPIQLTRAQAARLKSLAEARRTNISELVRAAVDSLIGAAKPGSPSLTHEEIEELLKNR